ncbi:hypothetical protein Pan14r_13070 [Crateriforma conspicua]|uniref:Uncharacterized protein n=1 Tax=Crateriforma conspicua TaxID=2527996 RepID=A0A5C5Y2U9_9PLAN|nr:hypothetical protein Mal65_26120 [Crateriforma conspicua]TWT69023.1 hypothetical protein Pan14r_13070 [Crateriforma conspicua]
MKDALGIAARLGGQRSMTVQKYELTCAERQFVRSNLLCNVLLPASIRRLEAKDACGVTVVGLV